MIRKSVSALLLSLTLLLPFVSKADEGMWLPMLIKRLNQADMQKMGLRLTADEIYNVNQASLKDAIVQLGGFCTGEFISKEGLLLTNHHCGYDAIATNSTTEHDYLTNGFWAMDRKQELGNPGLFVDILYRMDDVTKQVMEGVTADMSDADRDKKIKEAQKRIASEASENGKYVSYVRDFFAGNEFYLFVYTRYSDVRLVGAPPSAIGKFGGDTDNWMWPRHTGDFSMFRVYMNPDGTPSKEFNAANVPFKPKQHLKVSLSGVEEGDFAMVFGFPGRTQRFKTASGLKLDVEQLNPARIKLRTERLELMKQDMDKTDAVRLKYASEYANIANYWKYFIGQNEGIKRLHTIENKLAEEAKYQSWADADSKRKTTYGQALKDLDAAYAGMKEYNLSQVYLTEAAFASQTLQNALSYQGLYNSLKGGTGAASGSDAQVAELKKASEEFYKSYNAPTDQKITASLLKMYYTDVPKSQHPDIFKLVETKYKGDFNKFVDDMFKKSMFTDKAKVDAFLAKPTAKALDNDLAYKTVTSIYNNYVTNIAPKRAALNAQIEKANRAYVAGLREQNPEKKWYPDANSTIRLSYGEVKDYVPRDGVNYSYYTTIDGIFEKEDPKNEEFTVPAKLKEIWQKKDYGQYADANGEMKVGFITTNDITGGNSGSPVINGNGELIGLAFDGNWEAMTGDLVYDKDLKRCINVDIRYVLLIVDKMAGATHLIKEMDLVRTDNPKAGGKASEGPKAELPADMRNLSPDTNTETKVKTADTKIKSEPGKVKMKKKK